MSEAEPLHAMELWAQNVMGLKAVRVQLSEEGVIASGDNGAGKTTFLTLLQMLLGGKAALPPMPLREGAFHGELGTILGHDGKVKYRVEMELEQGKDPKLKLTDATGVAVPKPATVLAGLYGTLTFDVGAFMHPPGTKTLEAATKEQAKMLLEAVHLEIDLDAVAKKRDETFQRRAAANKDVEKHAAALRLVSKKEVPGRVDLDAKRADVRNSYETKQQANTILSRVQAIDRRGEEMKAEWAKLKAEREVLVKQHADLPPAADTATLETEISAGERTNEEAIRIAAGNAAYDEKMKALADAKKLSDELSEALKKIDADKLAALAKATFPYPGLSVDDVLGVTLTENEKTLPYSQLNEARKAEIAVAVRAAQAPTLRVARVDGNMFDNKTLAAIWRASRVRGLQLLIERVAKDQPGALIFEAGSIVGRVPEPVKT